MEQEILRRLENINIIRSRMTDFEWQATAEFWNNAEDDLRWAMSELLKFHKCDDGDCVAGYAHEGWTVWHREDS